MSKHEGVLDTNMLNCVPNVSKIPFLEFAYLSNSAVEDSISSIIKFNPISLSWTDFNRLFFTPGNKFFHINPANANSQALSFNQTYQEFSNHNILFNLSKSILNAWAVKHNLSVDSVPVSKKIELSKKLYLANNLVSIHGHVQGLSLHECIYALFKNGEVEPSTNVNDSALVDFVLSYKFNYEPLQTTIQTEFKYRVKIPGCKNIMKEKMIPDIQSVLDVPDVPDMNQNIKEYNPDSEDIPYPYSDDITPSRKLQPSVVSKAKNNMFEMKDDSSETSELKSIQNDDNDEHTIAQSVNIIHDVNQLLQSSDTYSDAGNNSDAGNTTHTNIKW